MISRDLLLIALQAYNMKIFLLYCQNEETLLSKHQHMKLANLFFAYDKAMPVSILLALISVATCWLLWKYRAILTNLVRLKIK